jgi:hypothetical protein
MISDCLNYNLRFTRGIEDVGVLVTRDGHASELRSVNGPNYGRVYDADVVDALVDLSSAAAGGSFGFLEPRSDKKIPITKPNRVPNQYAEPHALAALYYQLTIC